MDRQDILAGTCDLSEKLSPLPRGLRQVPVEDRRPIGLAALQGVVHEVADHDRVLSARADIDAAMAGRMAGRQHEPKRIVELIAVVDEQRLAGFDDRLAIVAKHIAAAAGAGFAALGRFLPGGIFAFVENIFGFRKCRHPPSVAQHRVPAAMVDMQMRAEHIIDVLEAQARGRETVEPGLFRKVHRRRIAFVLAGACIDEHRVPGRTHDIGLIGDDHFARRRIEDLGVKLREMAFTDNRVVGGEHLLRRPPRPVALDDADNGDVAN